MTNFFQKNGAFSWSSPYAIASIFALIFFSLSSCSVPRTTGYFKNLTRDTVLISPPVAAKELKIKKGDVLSIIISSLNKVEDEIYNSNQVSGSSSVAPGYHVDNAGEIYLHNIGKLKVEGFTRNELKVDLEKKLAPYLKDPIVSVNFENHHVTVIGEVGKSQVMPMPEEKMSIIDVLAQSGNIGPNAELTSVLVIRENENARELKRVNLEDQSIFNSSFYYLQPNDVVVLNVDEKKAQREIKRQNYQQVSTLVLQTLTMVLLIYQSFFRN